jgi:diguanylate cyclase (GGDEF)-like protein
MCDTSGTPSRASADARPRQEEGTMLEHDRKVQGKAIACPSPASLRRRLLLALGIAALGGAAVGSTLLLLLPALSFVAALVAVVAFAFLAVLGNEQVIASVAGSTADLKARYQSALTDSLTDPLTGLGNHRAFQEELDRQVELALRYETGLALVLIDLDDFKRINDGLGHAAGDGVLNAFGDLLRRTLRKPDRAFRIGGDEVAVLLPHGDPDGAKVVARRLLASALQPRRLGDLEDGVSFSAGISAIPVLAASRAELYAQADAALHEAKRAGRTLVAVHTPAEAAATPAHVDGGVLAEVIARRQLLGVYQPIIELTTLRTIGVEGLVRPQPPAPYANPGELFAAAEADGRTLLLDLACIDLLVAGATRLPPDQFLSVNLTPQTVEADEFGVGSLLSILRRHAFSADRLVIELTERAEINDMATVRTKLEACRRAGVRLAIDDLGAGNAGLRLLSELPFDVVKVDLNLVQRSTPGARASAIVGSVVDLARRTGALVIAEGVEEERQLAELASLSVQAGQGFWLGRPGPLSSAAPVPVGPRVPQLTDSTPMSAWREAIGLSSGTLSA